MQSMNINEFLYGGDKVREVIDKKMGVGMTMDESIDSLIDEVIEQTKREGEQGQHHGIVREIT